MCCGGRGRLDAGWRWLGAHRCKDGRAAARRNLDRSMGGEQRQCRWRWPAGALCAKAQLAARVSLAVSAMHMHMSVHPKSTIGYT